MIIPMKINCSVSKNSGGSIMKNEVVPIMYNPLYMSKLSQKKMRAISTLDVQIYKAFERRNMDHNELILHLNEICDTIEIIHDINKKNNLYRLFDDKIIPID